MIGHMGIGLFSNLNTLLKKNKQCYEDKEKHIIKHAHLPKYEQLFSLY